MAPGRSIMDTADVVVSLDTGIAMTGGFSGLAAASACAGRRDDFVVLERNEEIGGTWWITLPRLPCDVPSHLYSLSFAPNPDWTHSFSSQPEILADLQRLADEHDLRRSIRLRTAVESATWDEETGWWVLATSSGTVRARVPHRRPGAAQRTAPPRDPGAGHVRRHDVPLRALGPRPRPPRPPRGRDRDGRVGDPVRARDPAGGRAAARLPAHRAVGDAAHEPADLRARARALPPRARAQRLARAGVYAGREVLVPASPSARACCAWWSAPASPTGARRSPTRSCAGRSAPLRLGCKRILPSADWYPALGRPNVELVTRPIAEIRPHAIVTADGTERAVDTLHLGTGFHVADMPVGEWVRGRGGTQAGGRVAGEREGLPRHGHAGFPNLFFLLGPNTGLGHSSVVYMMESQLEYVLGALRRRGDGVVEVRPEAQAAFTAEIDRRMRRTVWASGCASWYQDATGRIPTIWPDWTWRFRRRTCAFEPEKFTIARRRRRRPRHRPGGVMGARVLITGARGGIGTATTAALRARGAGVLGLDLEGDGADVLACDVRDQAAVDAAVGRGGRRGSAGWTC